MPEEQIPDPAQAFQALLAKNNNDATAVASKLFDENFQLREKNRGLTEKLPGEGSTTLTADEAKQWKAYVDLGVDPKELKKSLEKLPALEKTNKELAAMENFRELSDIGLEGSKLKLSVLKDQMMSKFPDAAFSFKTEKDKEGKEAKVAYVKTAPDATEVSFNDFAAQNLSDYLPSLKVSAEAQPLLPGNTHDPKPQGGPASVFDRIRESVKAKAAEPAVDLAARFGKPANV